MNSEEERVMTGEGDKKIEWLDYYAPNLSRNHPYTNLWLLLNIHFFTINEYILHFKE